MITFKNSRTLAAAAALMALLLFTTCEKKRTNTRIYVLSNLFEVNSVATLKKVGTGIDGWTLTANYRQTADIVFTKKDGNWTPIDSSSNMRFTESNNGNGFTGTYNGNGFTIANLTIDSEESGVGLFGRMGTVGVVKNIRLIDCNITSTSSIGGVVGANYGTVENCYVTGNISGQGDAVGCVVGFNTGTVSNSYAIGNVSGRDEIGGVVGESRGTVKNSYATGNVSGEDEIGGVVGCNYGGKVTNSYATGNVSGRREVGGVVGRNTGGLVTNSYATGDVSGSSSIIGGVVGFNNATVTNSYATGNVSGGTTIGGVVGLNEDGTLTNSYATGDVSGINMYIGGVAGRNEGGTVSNSYAVGDISGSRYVGGVVGSNSNITGFTVHTGTVVISKGIVENCVALSGVINITTGTYTEFGRVVGENDRATLINNFARSDMNFTAITEEELAEELTSDAGNVNGEYITSAEWSNPSWWTKVVWNNESQTGGFAQYDMEYADWNSSSSWTEDDELDESFSDDSELNNSVWDFSNISETSYPQLRNMP